jgi:3'-phosphoadenosine 5'-phosphosulfate sulfotransferase (PAPS reductase)/FAD synthetase
MSAKKSLTTAAAKVKKAPPAPTARQLTTEPGTALTWSEYYLQDVVNLAWYDWVFINSSAGKDSQAQLDYLVDLALEQDCLDKLVVVHCDLGRIEWEGTRELAERQAAHYGLRFEVVRNENWPDLLARIEAHGRWPGRDTRYCTSEFKTGQARRLATRLVTEARANGLGMAQREVRILNCLGIRAQESHTRAKLTPYKHHPHYQLDKEGNRKDGNGWTNSKRWVDEWLPIHAWSADEVWARIKESGVEHHPAYDKGMPRLSCILCPLASFSANVMGAFLNPDLADEYVGVEDRIGHKYTPTFTIRQARDEANRMRAEMEAADLTVEDWEA